MENLGFDVLHRKEEHMRPDSPPNSRSGFIVLAAFTLAYLLASIVFAMRRGNSEFFFYIIVMFLLIGGVMWVNKRAGLTLVALWGLSIWGFLHMAGGLVPIPESWPINGETRVLYGLWLIPDRLKYDHIVHAYGFGVTTWVCWQALQGAMASRGGVRPTFGLLVLCAAAGRGFGAANEIVEFAATLLVPETNVGGYINTGWDLVANLFGAATAVVLIWFND